MKKKLAVLVCLAVLVGLAGCGGQQQQAKVIKIGINAEMTGEIPKVGESCKFAAQLWLEGVNKAGGLDVGGEKYTVELVFEDNESKAESASAAATKLITQDKVLIVIGPNASKQAVPGGEACNKLACPMISPWSTNPATTLDRPWVFRACFLDPFQGPVAANFVTEEFGFTKAAVLYDVASDYPKGLAEYFREAWEKLHGPGSVVAYESFTTKDRDFSAQLTKIIASGAEFLFTPQYYDEVPLILQQARDLGFNEPVVGSDSWGSAELVPLAGELCYGCFFSTHYAAAGATGACKEFIDAYNAKYGYIPDDVGALTWDSMLLAEQAIKATGGLSGDLVKDRQAVRDALTKIKDFDGITGKMTFTEEGDPIKAAVIVKISDQGEFEFYKSVSP